MGEECSVLRYRGMLADYTVNPLIANEEENTTNFHSEGDKERGSMSK